MDVCHLALGVAIGLAQAAPLPAASPAKPEPVDPGDAVHTALEQLRGSIQRATLKNGLRVVLNADHSSPTVALAVTYDVGARNESPGRSGFAHLFEHMMFQGSRHVPKGGHFNLISARGGTLNGTTSSDRTNYFEVLPSNELELGLWLEADRMRYLAVTPENFENQRAVVEEEYRMRYENAAYMRGMLRLSELAFENYWPYSHSAIGSMADLDAAKFEWVRDFHAQFYGPNNAVLTIAGDFDEEQILKLVNKYFGDAETVPRPAYVPPPLPKQTAERRVQVDDQNAKTPAVFYGWVIPETRTPIHYALELAASVLADGESSRLYQSLVHDRAVLRDVSAWTSDQRGPDLFTILATLTTKAKLTDVEQRLDAAIQKLASQGPTPAELARVQNRVRTHFLFGVEPNLGRATRLGEFETFWGDARLFTRELDAYLAVTPEQIKSAVAEYLVPARRSVIEVQPAAEAAQPAAPSSQPGPANPAAKPAPKPPSQTQTSQTRAPKPAAEQKGAP